MAIPATLADPVERSKTAASEDSTKKLIVGVEVGEKIGLDVGVKVVAGFKLGVLVGVGLGLKVGVEVGFGVGDKVGLGEGVFVGVKVKVGVKMDVGLGKEQELADSGVGVHTPQLPSPSVIRPMLISTPGSEV